MDTEKSMSSFSFFSMTASLFVTVYEYPTFATSGKTLIFFLLVCGVLWFLPVSLCSAELANVHGYQNGGIYSWVGKNLGTKWGFAAIFFQWFQVTVGFVTMIYFIIGTIAYIFNIPSINNDPLYKFLFVIGVFWTLTFLQFRGTKFTANLAKYGFSIGIILPLIIMTILAIIYFNSGNKISATFNSSSFIPTTSSFSAITSFVLAYMGVEASASNIKELKNSKKNYPRILIYLVLIGILTSVIGGSIVSMVSKGKISSNQGVMDALNILTTSSKTSVLVIILGLLIVFGVGAQVSSWIVSPTKGLQYVASLEIIPKKLSKKNAAGVPIKILFIQGLIVTIWAALLTFGSGSSGSNLSFLAAISLTVIIYLSAYILLFLSYLKLTFSKSDLKKDFEIPGGRFVRAIVATLGLLISIVAVLYAFVKPDTLSKSLGGVYLLLLAISYVITVCIPFVIYKYSKYKKVKDN